MPKYLLDTNVFITSQNAQYGMDFCPAFWDWLALKNQANCVFSIQHVRAELAKRDDQIHAWMKGDGKSLFLPFDQAATDMIPSLNTWTLNQSRFTDQARDEFFDSADMYLIAYALAHGYMIVTHEVSRPESKRKVFIPDVCASFGVKCILPWEMLRAEGARFVMQSTPGGGLIGFDALKG